VTSRWRLLIVAALLVAGTATTAHAAPAQACRLVQDAAGDASDQLNGTHVGPDEADLDIVSADIASNATTITTVVRVQHLGTALEAAGRRNLYRFFFHVGNREQNVVTLATRSVDGEKFAAIVPTEGTDVPGTDTEIAATGVFDVAHDEVRVSLPVKTANWNRRLPRGVQLTQLVAGTYRGVGAEAAGGADASTSIDWAGNGHSYVAGTPSCVRVRS
jgi:hypothetical protein